MSTDTNSNRVANNTEDRQNKPVFGDSLDIKNGDETSESISAVEKQTENLHNDHYSDDSFSNRIVKVIKSDRKASSVIAGLLVLIILLMLPTGYEEAAAYRGTDRVAARVLSTDESALRNAGMIQFGEQNCDIEILKGRFKGQIVPAVNMLQGSLDSDKIYAVGDKSLVLVSSIGGVISSVLMIDHYRIGVELVLVAIFVLLLLLFAGATGARAMLSFAVTVLAIWKVLVPAMLRGVNPVGIGMLFALAITVMSLSLIYGFDSRCMAASLGAMLGVLVTCIIGIVFSSLLKIHGAVMNYAQTLLYSGFDYLNLTDILKAAIFIGAAGAMTDLAVDITSAVHELVEQVPDISWQTAVKSGINVGKNAISTMVTTLLLAYSGGYMVLLMTFMAQGTPMGNIFNYNGVSAEILVTLAGSIGLVAVAPFTALCAGVLLTRRRGAA